MTKFEKQIIPNLAGVGLKADHYHQIIDETPNVGWFEVHPENYMGAGGPPHRYLTKIREDYPLSLHGVGMSLGGPKDRLDTDHLARFKKLVDQYEPGLISEHLAWSTHESHFLNDLLPLPYTDETLDLVARHVDEMQSFMGRQVLIENPSVYLGYETSPLAETEFLEALVKKTGCGLLLDVNNIFVSANNQGYDAFEYLDAFPHQYIGEIHLGGHSAEKVEEADGSISTLLIDDHSSAVIDPVWDLYQKLVQKTGALPSLMEWDGDIPTWEILHNEAKTADQFLGELSNKGDN